MTNGVRIVLGVTLLLGAIGAQATRHITEDAAWWAPATIMAFTWAALLCGTGLVASALTRKERDDP